jgi:hypothetical protein
LALVAGCAAVPAVPLSASREARDVLAPTGQLSVELDTDPTGVTEQLARELGRQLRVPVVLAGPPDVVFTRQRGNGFVFSPPYFENYAIGIRKDRSRALPFLRDFVDDAVQRGVVRDAIQREGSRGRM